jgi:hypothetical protein
MKPENAKIEELGKTLTVAENWTRFILPMQTNKEATSASDNNKSTDQEIATRVFEQLKKAGFREQVPDDDCLNSNLHSQFARLYFGVNSQPNVPQALFLPSLKLRLEKTGLITKGNQQYRAQFNTFEVFFFSWDIVFFVLEVTFLTAEGPLVVNSHLDAIKLTGSVSQTGAPRISYEEAEIEGGLGGFLEHMLRKHGVSALLLKTPWYWNDKAFSYTATAVNELIADIENISSSDVQNRERLAQKYSKQYSGNASIHGTSNLSFRSDVRTNHAFALQGGAVVLDNYAESKQGSFSRIYVSKMARITSFPLVMFAFGEYLTLLFLSDALLFNFQDSPEHLYRKKVAIEKFRQKVVDYRTNRRFSHASSETATQNIFTSWRDVFRIDVLGEEVRFDADACHQTLMELEENAKASTTRLYAYVSLFFGFLLGVAQVCGVSLMNFEEARPWVVTLTAGLIMGFGLGCLLYYKKQK